METSIVEISPRLMPGIRVGDSWLSAEPTDRTDHYGKPVWRYAIDTPDFEYEGDDLCGWGDASEMLASLVSFLSAAAEAYAYEMRGGDSDNGDLFPAQVMEWAYQESTELEYAAMALEQTDD